MVTRAAYIARGDSLPTSLVTANRSPIPDIGAEPWRRFVLALETQDLDGDTSDGLGRFAFRPRRLGDLGLMANLHRTPDETGRQVWNGDFVLPHTRERFLTSKSEQLNALVKSVTLHMADLKCLPEGVTKSGALGVLHAGGPGALRTWAKGPRFDRAVAVFNRTNGIF